MKSIEKLHVFALAAQGVGISGGDRIFIELTRRWSKKFPIEIFVWEEGRQMLKSQHLGITNKYEHRSGIVLHESKLLKYFKFNYVLGYIAAIIEGARLGLTLKLENKPTTHIYNASEFWMDSFPCILLKIRHPKIKWIATWYQTAPNPFKGYAEGKREVAYRFKALQYWLAQLPVKPLISKYANKVIVNNEDEKKRFPEHTKDGNTLVMIGAVPLESIKEWKGRRARVKKKYDAVFQGRFHPQKGVIEIIDIWRLVVNKKPDAKLGMIGDGPLMIDVRRKIKDLKLENNVKLFGYVFDGDVKYKLFASGKVVVHPAFYDSGGMASAEAMAFGLPCVGFKLKAYESYYPMGMIKVPIGDKKKFAMEVLKLLSDKFYYSKIAKEAIKMIELNWSWEKRSNQILSEILK